MSKIWCPVAYCENEVRTVDALCAKCKKAKDKIAVRRLMAPRDNGGHRRLRELIIPLARDALTVYGAMPLEELYRLCRLFGRPNRTMSMTLNDLLNVCYHEGWHVQGVAKMVTHVPRGDEVVSLARPVAP